MTDPILALALERIAGSINQLAIAVGSSDRPATKQDLLETENRLLAAIRELGTSEPDQKILTGLLMRESNIAHRLECLAAKTKSKS